MLGAILLCQYRGSILQDMHWWSDIQDPIMARLFEFSIQSNHLLDIQYRISRGIQTHFDYEKLMVLHTRLGQRSSTQQWSLRHRLRRQERCHASLATFIGWTWTGLSNMTGDGPEGKRLFIKELKWKWKKKFEFRTGKNESQTQFHNKLSTISNTRENLNWKKNKKKPKR